MLGGRASLYPERLDFERLVFNNSEAQDGTSYPKRAGKSYRMRALRPHFLPLSEISDSRGGFKLLDDRNQRASAVDQEQPPLMTEGIAINTPLPVMSIYRETSAKTTLRARGRTRPEQSAVALPRSPAQGHFDKSA